MDYRGTQTPPFGQFSGGGQFSGSASVRSIAASLSSSRTSSSTKRAIALTKVPSSTVALKRAFTSNNGGTSQQAESVVYNQPEDRITFADFLSCYFPLYKQTILGYGVNMIGRNSASTNIAEVGDDKSIFVPQGRQAWREYVSMPAYNLDILAIDNTMFDVTSLMKKAVDVVNLAVPPYNPFTTPANPQIADTDATKTLLQTMAFCYRGGYQVHTFTNEGTTDIHMECFEAQPRQPMSCVQSIAGVITYDGVGTNILRDYATFKPYGNAQPPLTNAGDTDGLNDMLVKLTPNCNGTHYLYKCSQPIKVMIPPGGVFKYKVTINPFCFTESEWNRLLFNTTTNATAALVNLATPFLIPAFSKTLCCRFTTEIGHETVAASATAFTTVGYMKGILSHTQTERHECRYMPYQNNNSTVLRNYLDVDVAEDLENINPTTNQPQNFNV